MVTTLPLKSIPEFREPTGDLFVRLGDRVWFALSQLVAVAGGSRPVKLTIDGALDAAAFDHVLEALKAISSANFAPDVTLPDFGGRVWHDRGAAELWWRSSTVPGRRMGIIIRFDDGTAELTWETGTGESSRHVAQVFSGILTEDLL